MLLKRVWHGGHRPGNVTDSGIGLSSHNSAGKSYRERFLPRGWMDSGLGSNNAGTVAEPVAAGEGGEVEISLASTKAVEEVEIDETSKGEISDLEAL